MGVFLLRIQERHDLMEPNNEAVPLYFVQAARLPTTLTKNRAESGVLYMENTASDTSGTYCLKNWRLSGLQGLSLTGYYTRYILV